MMNKSDAFKNSCRYCKAPKRHVGCRKNCIEYQQDLKKFQEYKEKEIKYIEDRKTTYDSKIKNNSKFCN